MDPWICLISSVLPVTLKIKFHGGVIIKKQNKFHIHHKFKKKKKRLLLFHQEDFS